MVKTVNEEETKKKKKITCMKQKGSNKETENLET